MSRRSPTLRCAFLPLALTMVTVAAVASLSGCSSPERYWQGKVAAATTAVRGKGHHAAEEQPNMKAKDTGDSAKTAATQGWLNQNFGVTLVMDDGTRSLGLVMTNKEGRALASELNPSSAVPGQVELVNVAGDDGWWRDPDADNAVVLIEILNTESQPAWRAAVARVLGKAKTPAAFKALRNALEKDADPIVRVGAEDGLVLLGTPEAVKALKAAAEKDSEQFVREEANKAIEKINAGK